MDRVIAVLAPVLDRLDYVLSGFRLTRVLADRQPPLSQLQIRLVLRLRVKTLARADAVADHAKLALLHILRVLLTQATCRRVARVSKRLTAFLLAQLIELREVLGTDKHLAAHLQESRGVAFKRVRDVLDHSCVGGDVFARHTVATRGSTGELTVFIHKVNGQPVDLQLSEVRARSLSQPITHLLFRENVIQAHHALWVGDVRKRTVIHWSADFLGR